MKKIALIFAALCLTAVLCGCQTAAASDAVPDDIPFEYFYRGFTHFNNVGEGYLEKIENGAAIYTEADWNDFCMHYSNIAGKYEPPDFSEYCLVVFCALNSGTASGTCSFDIDRLILDEGGHLTYDLAETGKSDKIWADNLDATGHLFINVLEVRTDDLPDDCISVYTASHTFS